MCASIRELLRKPRKGIYLSWDQWATVTVGAGGLIVAAVTLIHTVKNSQAKKYLDTLEGLHKAEELLTIWGPLTGSAASQSAEQRHQETLVRLSLEKRLHVTMYLDSVSRLSRPGTFSGLFLIAYAAIMLVPVFGRSFQHDASSSQGDAIALAIVQMLWLFMSVALGFAGYQKVRRRWQTRRMVHRMGMIDPVSVEGFRRLLHELRNIFGRARRSRFPPVTSGAEEPRICSPSSPPRNESVFVIGETASTGARSGPLSADQNEAN